MPRILAALMLLTVLGFPAPAAERAPTTPNDESTIRQFEDQERRGVLEQDTAALERLWDPEFMVNSPMNTVSLDRATVLGLVQAGRLRYASFERRIEHVRVLGDLALVMGAETVQPAAEPPTAPVQRRFTHVWRRADGTWRLVARHANNVVPRTTPK